MTADGVDIAWWSRTELTAGALLVAALGAAGVAAAVAGLTTSSGAGTRIAVGAIGAVLLAVGLALLAWRIAAPATAVLVATTAALELHGRHGLRWRLGWDDLTAAELVRARARVVTGVGWRWWFQLPRYYLLLPMRRGATRPEELARSGPPALDLGVPARTARQVAAALGHRLASPEPRRLDAAESARLRR